MCRLLNGGKHLSSKTSVRALTSKIELIETVPHQDTKIEINQAPNRATIWSNRQQSKSQIYVGPRFTQIDIAAQPNPLAAIELIKADPIRQVKERQVSCKGDSSLGHPNVFINLVHGNFYVYVFFRIAEK